MDMISNNPANLNEMVAFDYPGHEWVAVAAAETIKKYTDMPVIINKYFGPGVTLREGTDSYSYWLEGFPALGYWETELSPYYHTPADSVGICNIPYLAKVTGGILAALAEQDIFPSPQNLTAHSSKEEISLHWKATHTEHIRGFNVFRSGTSGAQYQKLTQIPVTDTIYHDLFAEPNTEYFYVLTVVNDSLQEGGFSEEVSGARFNFNDTLLVLASLTGTEVTPDSVYAFYDAVLDTIPYQWYDINATFKVDPDLLSRYRSILWMTNTSSFEVLDIKTKQRVSDFISSGGNLLFAGFNPMRFWMNTPPNKFALKIPETELFYRLFKVDSVTRKIQSFLYRANAVEDGYDTLNVDSLKCLNLSYPGQISNVDVFTPSEDGHVIYRFDSKFDSATSLGRLKNHPVGIEYRGPDFKSILLSFPLYYMDTNDVKNFFHFAVTEKFSHSLGIEPIRSVKPFDLCIYPNPISDMIFINDWNRDTRFSIFDMNGRIIKQNSNDNKIDVRQYPKGIYFIRIFTQGGKLICSGKFVKN